MEEEKAGKFDCDLLELQLGTPLSGITSTINKKGLPARVAY
jgi:hypothetical protein